MTQNKNQSPPAADQKPDSFGEIALYNQATNVAGLCRDLAKKKALTIGSRRFLPVEVWTTISVAHGCIATIKPDSVKEEVDGAGNLRGVRAIAQVKRQSDGVILSEAEGFVGVDEVDWYGSHGKPVPRYNKYKKCEEQKVVEKRADYAIRAMAQTRAVSRVCRTAFSHVVVMIDSDLSTTPFEEVSNEHDILDVQVTEREETRPEPPAEEKKPDAPAPAVPRDEVVKLRAQFEVGKWKAVKVHFGKNGPNGENAVAANKPGGLTLGDLSDKSLDWFIENYEPKPFGNKPPSDEDKIFRAALDAAGLERK